LRIGLRNHPVVCKSARTGVGSGTVHIGRFSGVEQKGDADQTVVKVRIHEASLEISPGQVVVSLRIVGAKLNRPLAEFQGLGLFSHEVMKRAQNIESHFVIRVNGQCALGIGYALGGVLSPAFLSAGKCE
jgi:hypothetical protein